MDRKLRAAVLTSSDSGYAGEREDKSGPVIVQYMTELGYEVTEQILLPDDQKMLEEAMIRIADEELADVLLTTGGTGFSQRDRMPEATKNVCERMAPGIPEAMRYYSMQITKRAMLSRAEAGIRKGTLIINLPGSPKAARENLEAVLPAVDHGLEMLAGKPADCAKLTD